MALIDDLVAACMSKEPVKIADAFNELMLGKTHALVQDHKQEIAQTVFSNTKED